MKRGTSRTARRKPATTLPRVTSAVIPLSVIVLAAGQGKRMKSALPKVLQPLAGRPLLARVLDTARALSPERVIVVHGHGGDRVRAAFPDADLRWTLQAEQRGTGHAVQLAMVDVPDDHVVLVLFGDVPLVAPATLAPLIDRARAGALALLTVELPDPTGYGRVLRGARGRVSAIVEHKDATAAQRRVRECNSGVLAAPARLLRGWLARLRSDNAQGELYLTDVVALAGKARVTVEAERVGDATDVLGVNDRRQLAQVEAVLRRRNADALLDAGATLADPSRVDVRGEVTVGSDVTIDVGAIFEGRVVLGDGVRIGPYCVLRDVTLGAGTSVAAYSVLDSAAAGRDCSIGPFSRLRPGAGLADEVHIGNFVEVKNSTLGTGAKANHLTYLGDATVGERVNVGAGTITCNYDGVNKHRTEIGARAFIGSGSMLVAPVRVGDGATIGAGSTITQDAPPEKLTLARSRQSTIDGWQRPVKGGGAKR